MKLVTLDTMRVRPGINKVLELIEEGYRRIVLEFPTGYGKSSGGLSIFQEINDLGFPESRIIHVLPLRAIVEKLAKTFYSELGERVAYQAGIYGLSAGDKTIIKSPFFDTDYNVTTFDSFIHNMFKIPITEVFRDLRHYYIPFERIYVSSIIFDEAHMVVDPNEGKMMAGFMASLESLRRIGNPVIIMSATLTDNVRKTIGKVLGEDVMFVRLGNKDEVSGHNIFVHDDEFETSIGGTKYESNFINSKEITKKAIDLVKDGKRVLIIINNIDVVRQIYEEIKGKGFSVGIIHSELTRRDRRDIMNKLDKDIEVLVGTSAVEAGVDVSFDALITVPDDAASLVQRVGRVCRYGGCTGELYFVCTGFTGNNDLCQYLMKNGDRINWRLPYSPKDENNTISYYELLEKFENEKISQSLQRVQNNIDKYRAQYGALGRPYVPQDLVNHIFKKFGFNLARMTLVEVYVKGKDGFISSSVDDVVMDSFSMDLEHVVTRIPANCIESLGYVDEEPNIIKNFPISDFVNDAFRAYERIVENIHRAPIVIIKSDCYKGV